MTQCTKIHNTRHVHRSYRAIADAYLAELSIGAAALAAALAAAVAVADAAPPRPSPSHDDACAISHDNVSPTLNGARKTRVRLALGNLSTRQREGDRTSLKSVPLATSLRIGSSPVTSDASLNAAIRVELSLSRIVCSARRRLTSRSRISLPRFLLARRLSYPK
jgi:hypothetical protein